MAMIECDKLEISNPNQGFFHFFANVNNTARATDDENNQIKFSKSLKKLNFKNMSLPDAFFNWSRNLDKIVETQDEEIETNYRGIEEFQKYKFIHDYIDPLEEFVVPGSLLSDHCLYILTHSPSFANLRVIDMRGNIIKSLQILKLNYSNNQVPMLEELYVDTVVGEGESCNISFFFEEPFERYCNLNVLWVESKDKDLYVENEKLDKSTKYLKCDSSSEEEKKDSNKYYSKKRPITYKFRKLFLGGINFVDQFGQDILNGLVNCEELTLKCCNFEILDFINPLNNLESLKSLSIIESDSIFDSLYKCANLHSSLNILKLNLIKSTEIMNIIEMFTSLNQLRIANINFKGNEIHFNSYQLPSTLRKFELIKCSVDTKSILDICDGNFCKVRDLTLLCNKYKKIGKNYPALNYSKNKITKLMFDDSILTLFSPAKDNPWKSMAKAFPKVEKIIYYTRDSKLEKVFYKIKH